MLSGIIFHLVVDFFNRINLIYGTVSEYCNETTCPTMSGGPRYEYLWADGDQFKKPTPLPAPRYIECLMDWTEGQINNEWYRICCYLIPAHMGNFSSITCICLKRISINKHNILFGFSYDQCISGVNGCSISENISKSMPKDFDAIVPRVRARIHTSF